jgi:hypothetical protein
MTYQTRLYIHGAVAAAIGGAANAVTLMIVDPLAFNLFQGGATKLGIAAIVSAIVSLATYMKVHPLPDPEKDIDAVEVARAKVAKIETMSGTGAGGPARLPVWILAAVLALCSLPMIGCGGVQNVPDVPMLVATTDKDVRAAEMKVYGILQASGVLLKQAVDVEQALASSGVIPPATDRQLKQQFRAIATESLATIDAIEHGHLTAQQLRARVDPIVKDIGALQALIKPGGHPTLMAIVDGLVQIAAAFLMNSPAFGGAQ